MTPSKALPAPKWLERIPFATLGELVVPLAVLAIVLATGRMGPHAIIRREPIRSVSGDPKGHGNHKTNCQNGSPREERGDRKPQNEPREPARSGENRANEPNGAAVWGENRANEPNESALRRQLWRTKKNR